jgi:hypothetical protein
MIVTEHEYHIIELNCSSAGIPLEVIKWLKENMGPNDSKRWFVKAPRVYFYNAKDHLMFLLKWS